MKARELKKIVFLSLLISICIFTQNVKADNSTTKIIDNLDAAFSMEGTWTGPYNGQGYSNSIHFSSKGNGSNIALWQTGTVAGETYSIYATWSPHNNRAKDAPYTIIDNENVLDRVEVNQELTPSDISFDGKNWKLLGIYVVSGNILTIKISNDADEYVIADAVMIVGPKE